MAHGNIGKKRTEQTKVLMSESAKKRWSNPEERKKQSERAKRQFSDPEVRKAISLRLIGNKNRAKKERNDEQATRDCV